MQLGEFGSHKELTMFHMDRITDEDYKKAFEQGQLISLQRVELKGLRRNFE
jgi:hypothetical protein